MKSGRVANTCPGSKVLPGLAVKRRRPRGESVNSGSPKLDDLKTTPPLKFDPLSGGGCLGIRCSDDLSKRVAEVSENLGAYSQNSTGECWPFAVGFGQQK